MTFNLRVSVAGVAMLVTAPFAAALNQDYYVHFSTYSGSGYADTYITAVSSGGTQLVKPATACGLRFEGYDTTSWLFGYGFNYSPDFSVWKNGGIDVWLPSAGCGAWGNLVVEPDSTGPGEASLVSPPGDFAGMLYVPDARAYWIDKDGKKLIYKHVCNDCSASSDFTYGSHGGVHGWVVVPEQLKTLTRSLGGMKDIRSIGLLLDLSQRSLQDLSRELAIKITARRSYKAARIESALRGLEDAATRNLNLAIARQLDCRAYQERGDVKSAANACQAAFNAVDQARGNVGSAENWITR